MAHRQVLRGFSGFQTVLRAQGAILCRNRNITTLLPKKPVPVYRLYAATVHTSSTRLNNHIISIQDEEDFSKRVLETQTPVIVNFRATWCGPCKLLGPRLESLVSAKNGKVLLAKVDIDDNPDLALEHGVQAVPTVLAIKGGNVQDKFVGLKDDSDLESFINKLILE